MGIHIDAKLTFNVHVSNICKKAANQLIALKRIKSYLGPEEKVLIFNSFILSNFNYCPLVWHFCGKVNTAKMEKIQKRALSYIYRDVKCPYDAFCQGAVHQHYFSVESENLPLKFLQLSMILIQFLWKTRSLWSHEIMTSETRTAPPPWF